MLGLADRPARRHLYAAVAGHHGEPPVEPEFFEDLSGVESARRFVQELQVLDGLAVSDDTIMNEADAQRLSWSLAGLTVVADWVGSNRDWFAFKPPNAPTADYWQATLDRASVALSEVGLGRSRIASRSIVDAFPVFESLRPMQQAAVDIVIEDEPTLVVMEDSTGSGKTEAALILAQRMMQKGLGEGIYVALPTMATANAMFDRVGRIYRRLFSADSMPSLALAHGRREQNDLFREAIHRGALSSKSESRLVHEEGETVAAYCGGWIADNRKKTFLAEVGVGTIDQAFLSILPVRFAVLRLHGLARRILVIDEAHACDSYMTAELERLLEMQALLGGSAIVMTATLSDELRQQLVDAYLRGRARRGSRRDRRRAGRRDIESFVPVGEYPMLTVVSAEGRKETIDIDRAPELAREVLVQRIDRVDDAVEKLIGSAASGCACAWVRNTVDDAVEGFKRLRAQGVDAELFHARFAMGDRLDIEQRIVERFGPQGTDDERRGRILVATQVIEASLDLDFDVLVSDLAPVDSLIQRAGRLWRHMGRRPEADRPVSRRVLHVLSDDPDRVTGTDWNGSISKGSAFVYGLPILWRSAKAIFETGMIRQPEGLQALIEAVIGPDRPEVPEVLTARELEIEGEDFAKSARGKSNAVSPMNGYMNSKPRCSDDRFPTRADLDSVEVLLVRRCGDGLTPVIEGDGDGAMATIGLNQRLLSHLIDAGGAPDVSSTPDFASGWPTWRQENLTMLLVDSGGSIGTGGNYDCVVGLTRVHAASNEKG